MTISERIYLDYAATAPLVPCAKQAFIEALNVTGNASSVHKSGRQARRVVEQDRELCAGLLGAQPSELIFTSGGTESNNLALKGLYAAAIKTNPGRNRIIVSAAEHSSVVDVVDWLRLNHGANVSIVEPSITGDITAANVRSVLGDNCDDVALMTFMSVNNETGVITDLAPLIALSHEIGCYFHIDAVAGVGHIPTDFTQLQATSLAFSGHKFGGPQGIGGLLISRDIALGALFHGGGQERDIRSGTLDVASIRAQASALQYCHQQHESTYTRLNELRSQLVKGIEDAVPEVYVNGSDRPDRQWPGILNLRFPGLEGDSLLMLLDAQGIECSHGAACNAGVASASHVLLAMGLSNDQARSSIRLSFGPELTGAQIEKICATLPGLVARARSAGMISC